MNEIRRDELHDTWVIMAPARANRPRDERVTSLATPAGDCPFCAGQEHRTLPPVAITRRGEGWGVRVVPNLYPAVTPPDGRHEVVVFSPDHDRMLADLTTAEVAEVLEVVRDRLAAIATEAPGLQPTFFVNAGAAAGASLHHPHGQILAAAERPPLLSIEVAAHARWRRGHQTCLLCHEAGAAAADALVVARQDGILVQAPVASRYAWELRFLPEAHAARFESAGTGVLQALAAMLVAACGALRLAADDPAYNLVLHSAPGGVDEFHWHLELTPRVAPLAGFETGTGLHINSLLPEVAAARLRELWHLEPTRHLA